MVGKFKDEINRVIVDSVFDFDFSSFGLQIEEDKIFCDEQLIQTFTIPSRYMTVEDLIVRQIIKANIYQLILNPNLISIQYLKLLQGTEINWELLQKWLAKCQDMDTAEAFKALDLTLPSIANQCKIVKYNNHLELGKIEIEKKKDALRYYLGGEFDEIGVTYLDVENFNFDVQPYNENILKRLPQPIASLLYLDQCEDIISRKNANLFHLFEAVANFHAIVCLSILKTINNTTSESIIDTIVKKHFFKGISNNGSDIVFTIGTWTSLLRTLIKNVKKNKIPYFNVTADEELIEALDEARTLRNENSGHAPRMSEKIEEELYTILKNHCDVIINALLKIYDKYTLIAGPYQVIEKSDDGGQILSCFKAMGNTPRFVHQKLQVYSNFDFQNHLIYLIPQTFHSIPIPILPFFTYMPLCEKDDKLQSLMYIHKIKMYHDNIVDERRITWHSYDCGDNNKKDKSYDEDRSTKELIDWLEPFWEKYFEEKNSKK